VNIHTVHDPQCLDTGMTPEIALLCELARIELDDLSRARALEILKSGPNWQTFLKAAAFHRLQLLIFPHLDRELKPLVPAEILQQMQSDYLWQIKWNMLVLAEFLKLNRQLMDAGIPIVAFKGPVTAITLYGDIFHRQFGDLDILVRESQLTAVCRLISQLGFKAHHYGKRLDEKYLNSRAYRKFAFQVELRKPGSPVAIDLHWRVRPRSIFALDSEEIASWCKEISIGSQTVKTFSPELLLVSHCLISTLDEWRHLTWIVDISRILLAHPPLDWARVEQLATRLSCMPMVAFGVSLANSILRTPAPAEILQKSDNKPMIELRKFAIESLAYTDAPGSRYGSIWRFNLTLRPALAERLKYAFHNFCEPNLDTLMRLTLPDNFLAWYYPYEAGCQIRRLILQAYKRLLS